MLQLYFHKGTRITVTIYLELQEKEKEQDENLMNLPVLVVDDDKTCCESTIATLKEIGITGEWVLSGREAVFSFLPEVNCRSVAVSRERNSGFAIKASTPAAFASSSISLNS